MRFELKERHAAAAIAAVLLAAILALLLVWAVHYRPPEPATGIPGEKLRYRLQTLDFAQENEEMLRRAVGELEKLPGNVFELFQDSESQKCIMNTGSWEPLENPSLQSLMKKGVFLIERSGSGNGWDFHILQESSLFRSREYILHYAPSDPTAGDDSSAWTPFGEGKHLHLDDYLLYNEADFYLQELGGGFWYCYRSLR